MSLHSSHDSPAAQAASDAAYIDGAWSAFDIDGSGFLDIHEFQRMIKVRVMLAYLYGRSTTMHPPYRDILQSTEDESL